MMFITWAQKVTTKFGYFLKKICHQDLSKIAQSGHTDRTTKLNLYLLKIIFLWTVSSEQEKNHSIKLIMFFDFS